MKYIKEYIDVNFFDEGYFTEIALSEYDNLMYIRRKLNDNDRKFRPNSRENIWLGKLDKWGDYSFCIEGGEMMSFFMVDDEISGWIYKLADEWYLVELSLHKSSYIKNIYYKCDQVDGLVNFFKSFKPSIWESNSSINEDFYYLYGSEDEIIRRIISRNIISMRDVSINYFKKVFDDVMVDTAMNVEFVYIDKPYGDVLSVFEYEDEWFVVENDSISYWCDQLEGVVRCINEKF